MGRQARSQKQAQARSVFRKQIQARNDAERAAILKDVPELTMDTQLGKPGCGAPNRLANGEVKTQLVRGLGRNELLEPDIAHGRVVLQQAKLEGGRKREGRDHAHKLPDPKYDPFAQPGAWRNRALKLGGNKFVKSSHHHRDPVAGASLSNTMGGQGGGAKVDRTQFPMLHIEEESYERELRAQEQGESVWGGQGCGAPIRTASGKIVTAMHPAAQDCATGMGVARVNKHKNMPRIKKEQDEFLDLKKKLAQCDHSREEMDDAHIATQENLMDKMRGHSTVPKGSVARHQRKFAHLEPNLLSEKDRRPETQSALDRRQHYAKFLKAQAAERRHSARGHKQRDQEKEMRHLVTIAEQAERSKQEHTNRVARAKSERNPIFTDSTAALETHPPRKAPGVIAVLSECLERDIRSKKAATSANKHRRKKEERQHLRNANRYFGKSQPKLARTQGGEHTARRQIPADPVDREYRLCMPHQEDY